MPLVLREEMVDDGARLAAMRVRALQSEVRIGDRDWQQRLGELVCAGLNVMGFSWIASPACTELETLVLDWLGRALGLPEASAQQLRAPSLGAAHEWCWWPAAPKS